MSLNKRFEKFLKGTCQPYPQKFYSNCIFYYGGKIGTYIEYEAHSVRLNSLDFKEGELFKTLSINQIVKIFKNSPHLKAFNFDVESIRLSTTAFTFYDCIIRLLNMRNKLAHEVVDLQFSNRDLIELLSHEQIAREQFDLLQNYDIRKMDEMTLYIASNIVYIRKLLSKLSDDVN